MITRTEEQGRSRVSGQRRRGNHDPGNGRWALATHRHRPHRVEQRGQPNRSAEACLASFPPRRAPPNSSGHLYAPPGQHRLGFPENLSLIKAADTASDLLDSSTLLHLAAVRGYTRPLPWLGLSLLHIRGALLSTKHRTWYRPTRKGGRFMHSRHHLERRVSRLSAFLDHMRWMCGKAWCGRVH